MDDDEPEESLLTQILTTVALGLLCWVILLSAIHFLWDL